MSDRFEGRVAVVTGGARGIGAAVARALSAAGAQVFVLDLLESDGIGEHLRGDLTEPAFVRSAFDRVKAATGRSDVLVNNAGVLLSEPFTGVSREDFRRVLDVNLEAVFFLSQRAARDMLPGSAIVNVASTSAFVSTPGQSVYEISKAGVRMLTKSLAVELAPRGIRVNAVAPGLIETEMTEVLFGSRQALEARVREKVPLGRPGRPEDVANAVVFLASDDAGYVYGETLLVDGGWVLP